MKNIVLLAFAILLVSCNNSITVENNDAKISFKNGDLMTDVSSDPMGNPLVYPKGEASITSQVKVWEPGFSSPWHFHPYQCAAYIIQGELTVNFDTNTSLDDLQADKESTMTQTYTAGEAFIGTANTWHYSENKGSEDLTFLVSWLGEKGMPIAVLEPAKE